MSTSVSTNYRALSPDEVDAVADQCANAWMDESIPLRQFEIVRPELEAMRKGTLCAPFAALVKCLRKLPLGFLAGKPRLLDVGCSTGYYSEVLKLAGFYFRYTGVDYSLTFQELAKRIYPDISFDVADARQLPFADDSYDIVLTGGTLMHVREYKQVIKECARVAKKYVVFHRTPVLMGKPTEFYEKEAYGVPCLEVHFSERELMGLFETNNLELLSTWPVFWEPGRGFGHMTYITLKVEIEPYASDKNV